MDRLDGLPRGDVLPRSVAGMSAGLSTTAWRTSPLRRFLRRSWRAVIAAWIVVGINSALRMDGEYGEERMRISGCKTLYYNLRAFMWGEMRDWLAGQVSIPNDHALKSELTAPRYSYRGGSLILESKDDMKARGVKSPNKADSLALTFADPRKTNEMNNHPLLSNPALMGRAPASRVGY